MQFLLCLVIVVFCFHHTINAVGNFCKDMSQFSTCQNFIASENEYMNIIELKPLKNDSSTDLLILEVFVLSDQDGLIRLSSDESNGTTLLFDFGLGTNSNKKISIREIIGGSDASITNDSNYLGTLPKATTIISKLRNFTLSSKNISVQISELKELHQLTYLNFSSLSHGCFFSCQLEATRFDLISFTNVTSETETIPTTNKTGNIQKGTSSAIKVTYIFSSLDSFLIVIIFVLLILYYFERKKKRGHQRLPEDSISFLSLRS